MQITLENGEEAQQPRRMNLQKGHNPFRAAVSALVLVGFLAFISRGAFQTLASEQETTPSSTSVNTSDIDLGLTPPKLSPLYELTNVKINTLDGDLNLLVDVTTTTDLNPILDQYIPYSYRLDTESEFLFDGIVLRSIKLEEREVIEEIDNGYPVRYEDSEFYYIGETVVAVPGIPEIIEETYLASYEDGVEVKRELINTRVKQNAVEELQYNGTLQKPLAQIASCNYWDGQIDAATANSSERYWLKSVMRCESKCNPNVASTLGPWHGLFQYNPRTFSASGGQNIYDGHEQITITLSKLRALWGEDALLKNQWSCHYPGLIEW